MVANADNVRSLAVEALKLVSTVVGSIAAARSAAPLPSCPAQELTCHCAVPPPTTCPACPSQAQLDPSVIGLVTVCSNFIVAALTFCLGRRSARLSNRIVQVKGGTKGGRWLDANSRK